MTIVKNAHADTRTFRAAAGFRMPDLTGTSLAPETFTVTYYDTMDHRLARHHIVLCRRVEGGDTRWELALYGHPLQPLMRCADRSLRPPSSFHDALYIHIHGHELTAMAKFRTHRMGTQVFDGDRLLATLMLDRVAQLDGRRVVRRFAELTLAPMETDESALNRIEGLLRAAGAIDGRECPTICEVIGLDRISQRPAVSPTAATVDHLKAYFATELETILTHDPGTRLGFDPEDLHQMRVASRRLRAALRAAKPMLVAEWADELQVDLSWLGDVLGTARDLDVLLENLNVDSATLDPPERHAFEKLTAPLEGERAEVRAVMIEALKSNRYLQLLDRLRSAADAPQVVGAGLSLRDVAAGEFKKLRKAVQALESQPTDSALHQVRIKVRRARYAAEIAEVAVGRPATRFVEQAKLLQQSLGEHQDAVIAEDRLRRLISDSCGVPAAFAAGLVVEQQRARRRAVRAAFADLWSKLQKRGRKAWG